MFFQPKYRLGHPGNHIFLSSKKTFLGSKYPKKQFIKFWKKNIGHGCLQIVLDSAFEHIHNMREPGCTSACVCAPGASQPKFYINATNGDLSNHLAMRAMHIAECDDSNPELDVSPVTDIKWSDIVLDGHSEWAAAQVEVSFRPVLLFSTLYEVYLGCFHPSNTILRNNSNIHNTCWGWPSRCTGSNKNICPQQCCLFSPHGSCNWYFPVTGPIFLFIVTPKQGRSAKLLDANCNFQSHASGN